MPQKLIVNGTPRAATNELPAFEDFDQFTLNASVQISSTRDAGTRQEVIIKDKEDIVELKFDDDSTWIGNADEFHEIFGTAVKRSAGEDGFEIPGTLQSTTDRNLLQDVSVKVFNLFSRKKNIATNAVKEIAKKLEDKVQSQPGLYLMDKLFRKQNAGSITDVSKPWLLFIHGTNSSTDGAFGAMMDNRQYGLWDSLLNKFGDKILGFDHKTLTVSPLQNCIDLLKLLPDGISLHLITHSRGGLVGDILAKLSISNDNIGFTEEELAPFAARKDDLSNIEIINTLARQKKITVQKYIRVASPSMGTSLLSSRLDHYLNTLLNFTGVATGMAANPVYLGVKALLAEVAACKEDIDVLPGLEAMVPGSPLVKTLNNQANVLKSPLIILSGNCTIHLQLKALLVIVTKLYFRRKNDMVVDTWSMYFGSPRKNAVYFFMDDGKETDHIHYFRNKNSQEAMARAIAAGEEEMIPGFKRLQDADIADANRNALLPFIAGEVKFEAGKVSGKKPVVIIIPGIMGSNLYKDNERIWVDMWRFIKGDLIKLDIAAKDITAQSLMGSGYKKLAIYLLNEYDVVTFAYDWRRPVSDEAKKFDNLVGALLANKQPIKVIAHSMGGVLFREFIMNGTQWPKLNTSDGFKALFLGVPLGGSYLIPETFTGRGGNISKLSTLDLKHDKKDLLKIFAQCPGLYNLLPLNTSPYDFADPAVWKEMIESSENIGTLPSKDIIDGFTSFRNNIVKNQQNIDYKNIIYIAGKSPQTTATYVIDKTGSRNKIIFKSTPEGDGSVTWESGIPAALKERDGGLYYCNTVHGELANEDGLFAAFNDLLKTGVTSRLNKKPAAIRGGLQLTDNPVYEMVPVHAGNIEKIALGINPADDAPATVTPLKTSMSSGDLSYALYPLLIGHFFKDGIMSAESVLDSHLKGMLKQKHALGIYPGRIGSNEVFLSKATSPKGAVIVGLGEAGELNGYQLELSITQGVSKFLLELREFAETNPEDYALIFKKGLGITALLVGCGYGGLSIESSIKSIILGVKKANENIDGLQNDSLKQIEHIEFIELYEDRALQAYYILQKLEADQHLNIVLSSNRIKKVPGIRKRVPLDDQQDWWQRVSVSLEKPVLIAADTATVPGKPRASSPKPPPPRVLKFTASTGSAREEIRNLDSNPVIIQAFIDEVSDNNQWTESLAKTIFELLIPNDFKDAVRNQYNILWKLDKDTAAYPWELLQDMATQKKPLCVNSGMIRQLATADYRTQIKRSYKNNALVIGDPDLDGFVNQLPGAAEEAKMVASIISETTEYAVTSVIHQPFTSTIQALFSDEYKIIHLAGHGTFNTASPEEAGMVIGNNIFLTTREINQMSQVPEFVFVNCCFLGKTDGDNERKMQQHYKRAASIGVQLIEMGVKAVIAAGWAVDDAAALLFAEKFYTEMFAGGTFSEAVKAARSACFESYPATNTWGAYQCYGDQFYKFSNRQETKEDKYTFISAMEIDVVLNNMMSRAADARYDKEALYKKFTTISKAIDESLLRDGTIAEQEANILLALNRQDLAIEKMENLRSYEQANYSVTVLEKLCSLYIHAIKSDSKATLEKIKERIDEFAFLTKIGNTCQRHCLMGDAYKLLLIKTLVDTDKLLALQQCAASYHSAWKISKKTDIPSLYALCCWLQAEAMLVLISKPVDTSWGKKSLNHYGENLPAAKKAMQILSALAEERSTGYGAENISGCFTDSTAVCIEAGNKITQASIIKKLKAHPDTYIKAGDQLNIGFLIEASSLSKSAKAAAFNTWLQKLYEQMAGTP